MKPPQDEEMSTILEERRQHHQAILRASEADGDTLSNIMASALSPEVLDSLGLVDSAYALCILGIMSWREAGIDPSGLLTYIKGVLESVHG